MKNQGMSLIEVMIAVAIFTSVMGVLFGFSLSFGDTAAIQRIQAQGNDELRGALQQLTPDIHQAIRSTINWGELPGEVLSYRVPEDLNGNGLPVDATGLLEMSLPRTISRDLEDVNMDGLREGQLIATNGRAIRVLANHLSLESEQPDAEGVFGPTEDANGNGQMDCGLWFEAWGRGLRITLQIVGETRRGLPIRTTIQEVIYPRN